MTKLKSIPSEGQTPLQAGEIRAQKFGLWFKLPTAKTIAGVALGGVAAYLASTALVRGAADPAAFQIGAGVALAAIAVGLVWASVFPATKPEDMTPEDRYRFGVGDLGDPGPRLADKWQCRLMDVADVVASWSKDPSTKVGCVIATDDRRVVSTGYNGLPQGVEDRPERMERPAKYQWTCHAEANAVANAARHGASLTGTTAFVTHHPCSGCAKSLIGAGVARVVVGSGATSMDASEFHVARIMFDEAGVNVVHLPDCDRLK